MNGFLRLTAASTKTVLRSGEMLTQAIMPVAYIAVLALLKQLNLQTPAGSVGILDYMATGLGVMLVSIGNAHAFLATVATYKSAGTLKRIAVTPIPRIAFIVAEVTPRLATGLAMITFYFAVAWGLGTHIRFGPQLWGILPVVLMITATALSTSFIIAGRTRSPQNANALDSFVSFPLYLFSGAMFPLAAFPDWLAHALAYIPYAGLLQTARGIALSGLPITDFGTQLAIGTGWLIVLFAVAVRSYRFTS